MTTAKEASARYLLAVAAAKNGATQTELVKLLRNAFGASVADATENAKRARESAAAEKAGDDGDGKAGNSSMADQLLELIGEIELLRDGDRCFAAPQIGNHREVHRIGSRSCQRWLGALWWQAKRKRLPRQALDEATDTLAARALHDGRAAEVSMRVGAGASGAIYLDLGTSDWSAIAIEATGGGGSSSSQRAT